MTTSTVVPGVYDLIIPQRATLRKTITLPALSSVSGIYAKIFSDEKRTRPILDLDVEIIETSPKYKIILKAEWDETRAITKDGFWDLLVVYSDTTRDHFLTGAAILSVRGTEAP